MTRMTSDDAFPGTSLDVDLLVAVTRLEQIAKEGPDTYSGLILERLITCDAPRLRRHISDAALAWEADHA